MATRAVFVYRRLLYNASVATAGHGVLSTRTERRATSTPTHILGFATFKRSYRSSLGTRRSQCPRAGHTPSEHPQTLTNFCTLR